jgi:hypothetical protein
MCSKNVEKTYQELKNYLLLPLFLNPSLCPPQPFNPNVECALLEKISHSMPAHTHTNAHANTYKKVNNY